MPLQKRDNRRGLSGGKRKGLESRKQGKIDIGFNLKIPRKGIESKDGDPMPPRPGPASFQPENPKKGN